MNNEQLAEAIEQQLLIDALESDPSLVRTRPILDRLDGIFDAWREYSDRHKHIRRMFRLTSMLGRISVPTTNVHEAPRARVYDDAFLEWFDRQIMQLEPKEKSLINFEIFKKRDRRRAQKWADKWGCSQRTYYYRLREVREHLVMAIVNRK